MKRLDFLAPKTALITLVILLFFVWIEGDGHAVFGIALTFIPVWSAFKFLENYHWMWVALWSACLLIASIFIDFRFSLVVGFLSIVFPTIIVLCYFVFAKLRSMKNK